MKRQLIAALCAALMMAPANAGIRIATGLPGTAMVPQAMTPPPGHVVGAEMAVRLVNAIAQQETKTWIVFPPPSIRIATSLLTGARGQTRVEVEKVLGSMYEPALIEYNDLLRQYERRQGELVGKSGAWLAHDTQFQPTWSAFVQKMLGSAPMLINFQRPTAAASQINAWFGSQNGQPADVVNANELADAKVVAASVSKFAAEWQEAFPPAYSGTFKLENGSQVDVPMMTAKRTVGLGELMGMPVAAVRFRSGSDLIIVKTGTLANSRKVFAAAAAGTMRIKTQDKEVDLTMPKFNVTTKVSVRQALESAGMRLPFSQKADLSGINGKQDLYISTLRLGNTFEFDEKGARGTQKDVGIAQSKSISFDPRFTLDTPYVFIVNAELPNGTRAMVVAGFVANPRS